MRLFVQPIYACKVKSCVKPFYYLLKFTKVSTARNTSCGYSDEMTIKMIIIIEEFALEKMRTLCKQTNRFKI